MAKGPKMKTHKASRKVFKLRKNGTLSYSKSNSRKQTASDTSKQVRQRRNKGTLAKGEAKRLKKVL